MNIYEEKSKEFLKFQKVLRELRLLRMGKTGTVTGQRIDLAMDALTLIVQELEQWLNEASKKDVGDYDI